MKKTVIKKRLVLKESVKEWLVIHAFGLAIYLSIFAWLFDSRKWGLIFACGFMALFIALEILVKIFKKVSKNLLTKLAK
jgi:hypothetical protein